MSDDDLQRFITLLSALTPQPQQDREQVIAEMMASNPGITRADVEWHMTLWDTGALVKPLVKPPSSPPQDQRHTGSALRSQERRPRPRSGP